MHDRLRLILLASVLLPSAAYAQSDDVVVMRRTVAPPSLEAAPSRQQVAWDPGAWSFESRDPACTESAARTRTVNCVTPTGAIVPPSTCKEARPPVRDTAPRYDGCTIDWTTGEYGAWSSTCSVDASRSRAVSCQRFGGTSVTTGVDASLCRTSKPDEIERREVTSSCTYTSEHGQPGQCIPSAEGSRTGTVTAPFTGCRRSDGQPADAGKCDNSPVTTACAITYTPGYAAAGACLPKTSGSTQGERTQEVTSCIRSSDGASVPVSQCGAAPLKTACTISYEATFGAFGACTGGTQTASVTSCTAVTGSERTSVSVANCSSVPAQTRTCQANCGVLQQGKSMSTYDPNEVTNRTKTVSGTAAEQLAQTRAYCESSVGPVGYKLYYCMAWDVKPNGGSSVAYAIYGKTSTSRITVGDADPNKYLASCVPQ
jgi:hypothetical protein